MYTLTVTDYYKYGKPFDLRGHLTRQARAVIAACETLMKEHLRYTPRTVLCYYAFVHRFPFKQRKTEHTITQSTARRHGATVPGCMKRLKALMKRTKRGLVKGIRDGF